MHMTEIEQNTISTFYDCLAPSYDLMTGFEKRFVAEKPFFKLLVERNNIRTALDAGCGSGFHSILLAQLGVDVTAIDLSPTMLEKVEAHATRYKTKIETVQSSFADVSRKVGKTFDAIFCMGNSLAHLRTPNELAEALHNFHLSLSVGGILFLQILNYERILRSKDKILSVKEEGGTTFVRFYNYHESSIEFNILELRNENGTIVHSIQSIELYPLQSSELLAALKQQDFTDIQRYGSIALEEFDPNVSRDLVVLVKKASADS